MNKLIALGILFLSSVTLFGQDEIGDLIPLTDFPESQNLTTQAESYVNAVVASDFDKVVELTHEDVIKMGGGPEYLLKDLKAEAQNQELQGFVYKNAEVGSHPEFLNSDGQLQTTIPVKYFLRFNNIEAESVVNLFAVSTDEGDTWKFVNLERFDDQSLREFVSNVSSEFVFPK